MGKRIIIRDASFPSSGMSEQYISRTAATEQGYVLLTGEYRTLSNKQTTYHASFVKTAESIILHPGDAIAAQLPSAGYLVALFGYTEVIADNYPSYTPGPGKTDEDTLYVSPAAPAARAQGSAYQRQAVMRNDTGQDLYVVIETRTGNTNDGGGTSRPGLTPATCGPIAYTICTDHPERYEEEGD